MRIRYAGGQPGSREGALIERCSPPADPLPVTGGEGDRAPQRAGFLDHVSLGVSHIRTGIDSDVAPSLQPRAGASASLSRPSFETAPALVPAGC
jgi:hypothetical protein